MRLDMMEIAHTTLHSKLDAARIGVVKMTTDDFMMMAQVHDQMITIMDFIESNGENAPLDPKAEFGIKCTTWTIELLEDFHKQCEKVLGDTGIPRFVIEAANRQKSRCESAIEYFTGIANSYMN